MSMSEHDASRREFLRRAAVGAGTVAGAGIVPEAFAQSREQDKKSTPETNAPPHSQSNGEGLGAFLNRDDAATVAAFPERLMPGEGRLFRVLIFCPARDFAQALQARSLR